MARSPANPKRKGPRSPKRKNGLGRSGVGGKRRSHWRCCCCQGCLYLQGLRCQLLWGWYRLVLVLGGALTDRLAVGGYGSHEEVGFQASSFAKSFTTGLALGGFAFGLYTKGFSTISTEIEGIWGGRREVRMRILEEVEFEIGNNFPLKGKKTT